MAPLLVQKNTSSYSGTVVANTNVSGITSALPSTPTSGNLLIIVIGNNTRNAGPSVVTDANSNAVTLEILQTRTTTNAVAVYAYKVPATPTNSFLVQFISNTSYTINFYEFSGVYSASSFSSGVYGNALATPNAAAITTFTSNDLVIQSISLNASQGSTAPTINNSYVALNSYPTGAINLTDAYYTGSVLSSSTPTWTINTSSAFASAGVVFQGYSSTVITNANAAAISPLVKITFNPTHIGVTAAAVAPSVTIVSIANPLVASVTAAGISGAASGSTTNNSPVSTANASAISPLITILAYPVAANATAVSLSVSVTKTTQGLPAVGQATAAAVAPSVTVVSIANPTTATVLSLAISPLVTIFVPPIVPNPLTATATANAVSPSAQVKNYAVGSFAATYATASTTGSNLANNFYFANVFAGANGTDVMLYAQGVVGETVTIIAPDATATYSDWQGQVTSVTSTGGRLTVPIGNRPTYLRLAASSAPSVQVYDVGSNMLTATNVTGTPTVTFTPTGTTYGISAALFNLVGKTDVMPTGGYIDNSTGSNDLSYSACGMNNSQAGGPFLGTFTFTYSAPINLTTVVFRQLPPWTEAQYSCAMVVGQLQYSTDGTTWLNAPTVAKNHWNSTGGYNNTTAFSYLGNLGATQCYSTFYDFSWVHIAKLSSRLSGVKGVRLQITQSTYGNFPDLQSVTGVDNTTFCQSADLSQFVALDAGSSYVPS